MMIIAIFLIFIVIGGCVSVLYWYSYSSGKEAERQRAMEKGVEDALETVKRRDARRNDSIDDVRDRLHKEASDK